MDFSRMKYRVDLLPEHERCIDAFPDLGDFAHIFDLESDLPRDIAGNLMVDNDKVLRYLIYMYSPNTPLPIQIPDIHKRKQYALKAVNIDADEETGFVSEGYNQLCMFSEYWAAIRFVTFCLIHDTGYLLVANTNLQVMTDVAVRLLTSSKDEKAADLKNLREELSKAQNAYEDALQRLVHQEAAAKNMEYIRYSIHNQNQGIRAEEYVKKFAERKKLFPNIIP